VVVGGGSGASVGRWSSVLQSYIVFIITTTTIVIVIITIIIMVIIITITIIIITVIIATPTPLYGAQDYCDKPWPLLALLQKMMG